MLHFAAILFGVSYSYPAGYASEQGLWLEYGVVVLVDDGLDQCKFYIDFVFLPPFDESRLEIEFFFRDFFEIDIWVDDTGLDEFFAVSVSFIQINGSDEGFEGIAEHVVVVRTGAHGIGDEIIET